MRSPAANRLNTVSFALAVGGVAVAAYLTLVHYRDELLVCAVGGSIGEDVAAGGCDAAAGSS